MTINRRGKGWQVTVQRKGKRVRKTFPTKREAEQWEKTTLANLDRGVEPDSSAARHGTPTTLGQLQELTMRLVWKGTKGERTAQTNSVEVVEILGKDTALMFIDRGAVQQLVGVLKERGQEPGTINRKLAALSRMLTLAEESGAIDTRPVIRRLKESAGRTRWLSSDEQNELFSEMGAESRWIRLLCVFLVETGLRVSEARALRWGDLSNGTATVRQSKSGSARSVPLTNAARLAVAQCDEFDGGPFYGVSQTQLTHVWNKAKARLSWAAGDVEVVPHCLRHTCASRLVMGGCDILTVQKWLGHKTLRVTLRYAHLAPDALEDAKDKLEELQTED